MAKSAFINDGYTREGYIAETEFYPACRFTYRPCTDTENQVIKDKVATEKEIRGIEAGQKILGEWLAERISKWDLLDQGNHVVPVTGKNVERLAPVFFTRLWGILIGERLNDPDPKTGEVPSSETEAVKN